MRSAGTLHTKSQEERQDAESVSHIKGQKSTNTPKAQGTFF